MDYIKHFDKVVDLAQDGPIATITFVCPENGNRMNEQWVDEYGTALRTAVRDRDTRVVVLKAEGDVFMGQGDLTYMIAPVMMKGVSYSRRIMHDIGDIVRTMYRSAQPIIAAVDGLAIGGGCGITLSSDILIASPKARFDESIFAKSCLPCDSGGLWSLQRLVGPQNAKYLALSPDGVDAEEAFRLGLVAKVVPSDQLDAEVGRLAQYIAGLSPVGVNAIKQISNRLPEYSLDTYLQQEAEYISNGINSKDFAELVAALTAGRAPHYTGD
jgi:enoyl-CoA hydratase/carnithine racemase